MNDHDSIFEHANRLTRIFGYWPSFHDAEVMDIFLSRGELDPANDSYRFPELTVRLHVFELAKESDTSTRLIQRLHTIATLRFHGVAEDIELAGFNCQNAISALTVEPRKHNDSASTKLHAEFRPAYGMGATFTCDRAEVLDAVPCDDKGRPTIYKSVVS